MKKNKYIVIILISVLIIMGFLFLNFHPSQSPFGRGEEKIAPKSFSNINNINAYINVLDKNYSVKTEEGATALDVMKSAQNSGFFFKGKEYPGLGFFVEEINGIKAEKGKYWIYSINEQEAEIGVSQYVVKNGDIISWKLK